MEIGPPCGACGTPLVRGLCPRCLLNVGLSPEPDEVPDPHPASGHPLPSDGRGAGVEGMRLGDYELLEEIGRGGMGIVYRARQVSLYRTVAVKLLPFGGLGGADAALRLRAEAVAAGSLRHPNIVAVHEVGLHQGQHFLAMDYVAGPSLARVLRDGPLPARRAAALVRQVALAVQHAHERGIIHRDLKPSNILLDAADDEPRVTDFGLAKNLHSDTQLTLSGQTLGSPNYIPPEQVRGQDAASLRLAASGNARGEADDPAEAAALPDAKRRRSTAQVSFASDVYGLGAVLYHALTGRPPFQGENIPDVLRQVMDEEPLPPRRLNPSIPRDLETICLKCLEKEPARRYGTTQALADDLGRWIEGEPVRAHPVTRAERTVRWCRRKPALASFIAATLLLLLAIAVGSPIALYRIEHERRRAEQGERVARQQAYAADMNLAQQSLKLNNLGKARRLLNRHRPSSGNEDLRGWEWRYLWQLTRSSALVTLTNRPTRGFYVSFSPDGTRLAVGWMDGHVDLWDVPGRRLIRPLTDREYVQSAARVAFSPVRNLLVATSGPKVVTLYDLDSGRESILWRAPDQGAWGVRSLTFSPDGSRVVIYAILAPETGDAVWVVNVASSQIESRHPTSHSGTYLHGAAHLSPDNRRLYLAHSDSLNYRYSIQCLDLVTGQELWQTEPQRDYGLTTLALSPDGRVLASGSGYEDPTIRIWDAATGRFLVRLNGHTSWVGELVFTRDGRRLISAGGDQSIRVWDTSNWTETQVLRGHTDVVHAVAISESAQLIASAGADGNLMLWKEDGLNATDGYRRLPEALQANQVLSLDHSRVLLLPPSQSPELVDLKRDSLPVSLPGIGLSTNVLGCFGANILCHWNGTNQILVRELLGAEFILRGAISLDSGIRPTGFAYNPTRQLLAWTEGTSLTSVYLASLATPDRRIELTSDVPGLVPIHFSEDGDFLATWTQERDSVRTWNVETGQIVASITVAAVAAVAHAGVPIADAKFAAGGRVLVVAITRGNDHEIGFYDLAHPERAPRRVFGRYVSGSLAVSPVGGLVASVTQGGLVRLFDPAKGEWIEDLRGQLGKAWGIAFSADGRRLFSTADALEAVKLWDVGTRQELLTLDGSGSLLSAARWSADGDVILAGAPWQAWRAPSWEEIATAEAKEKTETKRP